MGHLDLYNKNQIREKLLLVLIFLNHRKFLPMIQKRSAGMRSSRR